MEIQKFTDEDLAVIKAEYKSGINFYARLIGGMVIISTILLFVPASLLGRRARRAGVTDSIIESFGVANSIMYMVLALILLGTVFYFILNLRGLKKDVELQEKITIKAKVVRLENVPANIVKDMEGGKDTILHFDDTETKIKDFYFNKHINPELLTAKYVYIERTRYGKRDLKHQIVEEV